MAKYKNLCIICNSPYSKEVNQKLTDGISYAKIKKFLGNKGISISTTSIGRHKKNHLVDPKKPKIMQKEAMRKISKKVDSNHKNAKTRATKNNKNPERQIKAETKMIHDISPEKPVTDLLEATTFNYQDELKKMTEDFDAINELLETLAISKNRMKRALKEEYDNELVLSTTGKAIKDYASLVSEFKELISGSESIAKMRFTQLVNMITGIFGNTDISDQTRHELFELLGDSNQDESPKNSLRPSSSPIV